jgi:uncharacterized protein YwqG
MDRDAAIRVIDGSRFAKHRKQLVDGLQESVRIQPHRVEAANLPLGASRFGGAPDVPAGFQWPRWLAWRLEYDARVRKFCRTPPRETMLEFMAQFHIDELPAFARQLLPASGWLCFFSDHYNQFGGGAEQHGGWRVIHFEAEASQLIRTEEPNSNPLIGSDVCRLHFSTEWTIPSWCPLTSPYEDHEQALVELLTGLNGASWTPTRGGIQRPPIAHRLLGQPDLIHDDMRADCELAANGVSWTNHREYLALRASAKDRAKEWRLLLQLDTDDNVGWMFGDAGRIYFYIRDEDLRGQAFAQCWLGLQCY